MPAARAAVRVPAPAPPPAPTKRIARAKQGSPSPAGGEADALADQLGRVLKVSQPKVPAKPRIPASTKSTVSTTTTASTRTAATSSRTATTAATSRITSRPTTATSSDKGKAKAPDESSTMPDWAVGKSTLRPGDRARLAMAALNESLKSLSEAYQAGYRHGQGQGQQPKSSAAKTPTASGSTSSRTAEASRPGHDQWDDKRVQSVMSMCETALRVLRDMNDKGELGGKGVEVERAAQGLVAKCLYLGMFRKALELLCEARPRILKLYTPTPTTVVASSLISRAGPETKPGSLIQQRSQLAAVASRSRLQPVASSSRTPNTVPTKPLPTSWAELLWFPSAIKGEELSEVLKSIMFQAMMAAWISLVALAVEYKVPISKLLPLPIADTTDPERLHPFRLALGLPRQSVTPLSHMFYRHISATQHSAQSDWSHAKCLGLAALVIAVEIVPDDAPGKVTPSSIWDLSHRIVSDRVSKSDQARTLEEGEEIIAWLVGWAETAISEHKEERSKWFDGKAWLSLMDLWIGLARRLNQSDIIDKALSYMTASTSLGPSTPKSSTPPASLMSRPSERSLKSKGGVKKPEEEVIKMCGDLARVNVYSNSDPIAFAAAGSSLRSTDLEALSEALASLPNDEAGKACLGKAVRGVERVRRGCVKAIETATKHDPASSFGSAAVQWLTSSIELVEDVLQNVDMDLGSAAFDLVAGAIDSLTTLARIPLPGISESSHILAHLDRGTRLCQVSSGRTSPADRADWLRCLSVSAFNHGAKLWKEGKAAEAARFASPSCEYAEAALKLLEETSGDVSEPDSGSIKAMREQLPKRYELLAACHQKCGDKKAAFNALAGAIAGYPASILDILSESLASLPLAAAFRPQGELDSLLVRLSLLIISDPAVIRDDVRQLVTTMESKGYKPEVVAGILERLETLLEEGTHKPEVAAVMLEVGESCLTVASVREMPVRRLRIIMRLMAAIISSGQRPERFDVLSDEASHLVSVESLGVDSALAQYRREYHAAILLIRALRAYHIESEAATSVSQLGTQALEELRHLVLPPPAQDLPASPRPVEQSRKRAPNKTAVPKTPARTGRAIKTPARRVSDPKVQPKTPAPKMRKELSAPAKRRSSLPTATTFDDLGKLTGYIESLASLLGLMGLVLAKVEALKVMRALLRHREDRVDDFVRSSGILAMEYCKLGKQSRAGMVFQQALRCAKESKREVGVTVKAELHLRHSAYLAQNERVDKATGEYREAMDLSNEMQPLKTASLTTRVLEKSSQLELAALARIAMSHICVAQRQTSASILHLSGAFRLFSRAADVICRIASTETKETPTIKDSDDPFSAPASTTLKGQDEPAKDDTQAANRQVSVFTGKYLSSLQWHAAENLLSATFDLATAFAQRGSVRDCEYFLKQAGTIALAVKSGVMQSRAEARSAELEYRLRKYEASAQRLGEASNGLTISVGPDAIDIKRIQGDVFSRQEMIEEAGQIFEITGKELVGLDEAFVATEALVQSPRKVATANDVKEPLLPTALAHVLGQQAWLYREAGFKDDSDALMTELAKLAASAATRAEEMYLQGRIGLHEALEQFKADLFMSSLTESTIAMPMGLPAKRPSERLSSRIKIQNVLERAEFSFRSALELFTDGAPVEDVRQARLNLALLHAFQTSLQHGSDTVTATAADILASNPSMTFHRERLEAIDCKFAEVDHDDLKWPTISGTATSIIPLENGFDTDMDDDQLQFRTYWNSIKNRHAAAHSIPTKPLDLSRVPPDWAVISINVTEDHNTMFISRHQRNHQPLVFCLPLDRQGRREGEDEADLFTFDTAAHEMEDIIRSSNESARNAKSVETREQKVAWWEERYGLDKRMEEMLLNMEFVWLGPFKTILSPRGKLDESTLASFRERLERIFIAALGGAGTDIKKCSTVKLAKPLIECFATLSSKCKDEEVEDLVYFVLDIYQFHGIPVALAELDIDQIGIDVKSALAELEGSRTDTQSTNDEHLFLVLDKNVQSFPWESIPILRGRAVSRIPSLPFLLDQVALVGELQASATAAAPALMLGAAPTSQLTSSIPARESRSVKPSEPPAMLAVGTSASASTAIPASSTSSDLRLSLDSRKVFYILNPSGDLSRTQTHFEPWLASMISKAGWKGISGRPPTELELTSALREYDLVLYFGHGGAEQYIRSHKVRHLTRCATTMLWGCSSGHLKDQGDLDRTGTAWNYMMAGCPSLVANLWDVTDRDIDRLSEAVFHKLHLDASHVPDVKAKTLGVMPLSEMSTVQAVNASREDCKLKYLTGAAPVVYGLPVYLH